MKKLLNSFYIIALTLNLLFSSVAPVYGQDQLPPCDELGEGEVADPGNNCEDTNKGLGNNPDGTDPDNPGHSEPTATPTEEPVPAPTQESAATPTEESAAAPTEEPTAAPTEEPTAAPTEEPAAAPTEEPAAAPTEEPTATPTEEPTVTPTEESAARRAVEPTVEPTNEPAVLESAGEIDTAAASNSPYTSRIFLQNPHASISSYAITYKQTAGADIIGSSGNLSANGGVVVDLASESGVSSGFKGSGVVAASNALAALVVQYGSTDVMVSNGFLGSEGGTSLFAPSVQCKYVSVQEQTAELAVQNASSGNVDITLTLNRAGDAPVVNGPITIESGKSHFFDIPSILGGACNNWLGSGSVTATGNVVGIVNTTYGLTNQAFSAEMVATGGNTLYFPTFQYNYAPPINFNTNVAVQNTSTTNSIIVCAEYFGPSGKEGSTVQKNLGPLGKDSVRSSEMGLSGGNLGAATFKAYASGSCGSPGAPVDTFVAVMNQFGLGDTNRVTSYVGFVGGNLNIAFPFGNWSPASTELDTYFAVQNVSGSTATVTANFYETGGGLKTLGPFNVLPGSKANPRISDLSGVGTGGNWKGVVEIISNQPVVGIGTVQPGTFNQLASYNSIPYTP